MLVYGSFFLCMLLLLDSVYPSSVPPRTNRPDELKRIVCTERHTESERPCMTRGAVERLDVCSLPVLCVCTMFAPENVMDG